MAIFKDKKKKKKDTDEEKEVTTGHEDVIGEDEGVTFEIEGEEKEKPTPPPPPAPKAKQGKAMPVVSVKMPIPEVLRRIRKLQDSEARELYVQVIDGEKDQEELQQLIDILPDEYKD